VISIAFLLMAASAQLDALNHAVARCDRGSVNPVLAAETATRSSFLLDAFREQEAIVAARLDLAQRRAMLREDGAIKAGDEKRLSLEQAAIDDRQRALNDRRMLEGIRRDAMDSMRRYFLMNCPAGRTDK
jgi:hypothetical protein